MTRFILLLMISVSMLMIAPYVGYSANVRLNKQFKPGFPPGSIGERGRRRELDRSELKERIEDRRSNEEEERGGRIRERRNEIREKQEEEE